LNSEQNVEECDLPAGRQAQLKLNQGTEAGNTKSTHFYKELSIKTKEYNT
jgi:hypothetical protein